MEASHPALARAALTGLAACAGLWLAARADLLLRQRSALAEGEGYLAWAREPSLQSAHWDAVLERRRAELSARAGSGALSPQELELALEQARLERDLGAAQPPAGYAAAWLRSAAELFTPPESRWAARARERLALLPEPR